jgi:hypothetical protein
MPRSISERDWKIFRELHEVALERLCGNILDEAGQEIQAGAKSAHERYLELYKLIHKRDKDVARGFNDFRRSTALTQIGIIYSMGLFTTDELRRFSPEMLEVVEIMCGPIPDTARPSTEPGS